VLQKLVLIATSLIAVQDPEVCYVGKKTLSQASSGSSATGSAAAPFYIHVRRVGSKA
jgi:hypothetical protein